MIGLQKEPADGPVGTGCPVQSGNHVVTFQTSDETVLNFLGLIENHTNNSRFYCLVCLKRLYLRSRISSVEPFCRRITLWFWD